MTAGYRIIAPSRFGYLRTDFPADASSERQADVLVELLDYLGIDRLPVAVGWRAAGAGLRHPSLAISMEDDRFGTLQTARHIATAVPGAKLVIYPTGGHIWAGNNSSVFAEIDRFLRGLA